MIGNAIGATALIIPIIFFIFLNDSTTPFAPSFAEEPSFDDEGDLPENNPDLLVPKPDLFELSLVLFVGYLFPKLLIKKVK